MRIAFIVYQGNTSPAGRASSSTTSPVSLLRLGHEVHVIAGRPFPEVDEGVHFHKLKTYRMWDFMDDIDEYRFLHQPARSSSTPSTSTRWRRRASRWARSSSCSACGPTTSCTSSPARAPFDLVHDNQTLSYGILLMKEKGLPVVASIHHPLTIDRRNRLAQVKGLAPEDGGLPLVPLGHAGLRCPPRRPHHHLLPQLRATPSPRPAFAGASTSASSPTASTWTPSAPSTTSRRSRTASSSSATPRTGTRASLYLLEAAHDLRHKLDFRMTFIDHRPPKHLKTVQALMEKYRLYNHMRLPRQAPAPRTWCACTVARRSSSAPSLYEGFGLPAVEAMACGVPVVATSAGALSEIIEDGVTGITVPPADSDALSEALRRLLSDPELCRRMGEAGRAARRREVHLAPDRPSHRARSTKRSVGRRRRGEA